MRDDRPVLEFYWAHRADDAPALARAVLQNEAFWGGDLTLVPGLEAAVAEGLAGIRREGAYAMLRAVQ